MRQRACFNPRPPLLAGDAGRPRQRTPPRHVSIRARHCWRAMPTQAFYKSQPHRFNPRPPLLAGDAATRSQAAYPQPVSIRARHCWRAMRQRSHCLAPPINVSIRARHCWRAMLFQRDASPCACSFQSAPAIAGGRCDHRPPAVDNPDCFNPRPPLLAGDARASWRARPWRRRFNPRPPLLAGDANVLAAADRGHTEFQSAPAIAGGRCSRTPCVTPGAARFNPRPPLLAGDALPGRRRSAAALVSIRARHCWRAMPHPHDQARVLHQRFNPRPPLLAGDACYLPLLRRWRHVSIRARHCWRAMLAACA